MAMKSTSNNGPIPTSTPNCVIIKSYKAVLPKPIASLKFQTQFSDDFPLFLRGKIEENEFRVSIDINICSIYLIIFNSFIAYN